MIASILPERKTLKKVVQRNREELLTDSTGGAILQQDVGYLCGYYPHFAGIITPGRLGTIASVRRNYQVPVLKITSGL